eukprot:s1487_g4.t1
MRDGRPGANVLHRARRHGTPEWRSFPRLASVFLKKWRGSAGTLLEVMETMTRQAVDTNAFHFSAAIGSLATGAWPAALQLICASMAQRLQQNVVIYGAALQSCASDWPAALGFLELMKRNQDGRRGDKTRGLLHESSTMKREYWQGAEGSRIGWMRCEGLVPDVITYNTVMDVCQKSGHWKLALQIFQQLGSETADVISMNTAMGAFLRLGFVILRGPEKLGQKDWKMKGGNWQQVLLLLSEMPQRQLVPSTISCNIGIKACESGGRWDLGIHLLRSMQQQQIAASTVTYNTLLSILQKCRDTQSSLQNRSIRTAFGLVIFEGCGFFWSFGTCCSGDPSPAFL